MTGRIAKANRNFSELMDQHMEFLDQEIENYQNNQFMKFYGEVIKTGKQPEIDFDWEERLNEYMESIYEEFNQNCTEGPNFRCENCPRQYKHEVGHRHHANWEGWNTDHHGFEWAMLCCWYCCKPDEYGMCDHQ